MATQTTHYNLIKPSSADRVAVGDLNDNADTIDGYLYKANERADQIADDYNASETYNTGDYVRRENYLYKCNTDNTTGTWDDTKWDRVKVMDEITQGGGGGSSTLAGLNDVNISSPTDGQALIYNNATGKWENKAGGGGSSTFAGLNDVDVAGVANNDIARFNSSTNKWEKSSDLTDLELSVSQLSSSVLSIAGDVDTLELTVSQMSASTLPYDANISTKQKIDNVESSIPTSASDLPYSSTQSTKQAIDELKTQYTLRHHSIQDAGIGQGEEYRDISFNFGKTYQNLPIVETQVYTGTGTRGNVPIVVVTSLTTSKVDLRVWRQNGASTTYGMSPIVHIMVYSNE